MKQLASYPVVRTTKFAQTVGFYEDLFGLIPFYETDGYARLRHPESKDVVLSVIDAAHEYIPASLHQSTGTQFLSFISGDFDTVFEAVYMEGLDILKERTELGSGVKHFMFADPYNDVVINLMNCAAVATDDMPSQCEANAERGAKEETGCACC